MSKSMKSTASTSVALSEKQRSKIAQELGIKAKYIPKALPVIGVEKASAESVGIVRTGQVKFTPAIIAV